MSWSKNVTIFCDGDDCPELEDTIASTVTEARRSHIPSGWGRRDGKDLCPKCMGRDD